MFRKPLPSGSVRRPALTLEPLEGRDTPAFLTGAEVVAAADAGSPPLIRIIDPTTQVTETQFLAYDAGFYGGVRVAVGDVTGDGYPDLVVAAGPSGGPAVQVYDGATGARVSSFFVFDPSFTENAGTGSSLTMVPTPTPSAMVAPTGALRFMVKVSSNSYSVSPAMGTESVPPVVPGGRLSVPGVGV